MLEQPPKQERPESIALARAEAFLEERKRELRKQYEGTSFAEECEKSIEPSLTLARNEVDALYKNIFGDDLSLPTSDDFLAARAVAIIEKFHDKMWKKISHEASKDLDDKFL